MPCAQVVGPVHPIPPHCPYKGEPPALTPVVVIRAVDVVLVVVITAGVVVLVMRVVVGALDVDVGALSAPQVYAVCWSCISLSLCF